MIIGGGLAAAAALIAAGLIRKKKWAEKTSLSGCCAATPGCFIICVHTI